MSNVENDITIYDAFRILQKALTDAELHKNLEYCQVILKEYLGQLELLLAKENLNDTL